MWGVGVEHDTPTRHTTLGVAFPMTYQTLLFENRDGSHS